MVNIKHPTSDPRYDKKFSEIIEGGIKNLIISPVA